MQGYAYRCDTCGRISFIPESASDDLYIPPPGWLGVSEVDGEGAPGPADSFCSWDCLHTHAGEIAAGGPVSFKQPVTPRSVSTDAEPAPA